MMMLYGWYHDVSDIRRRGREPRFRRSSLRERDRRSCGCRRRGAAVSQITVARNRRVIAVFMAEGRGSLRRVKSCLAAFLVVLRRRGGGGSRRRRVNPVGGIGQRWQWLQLRAGPVAMNMIDGAEFMIR